jgi:hypothetical protein
MFGAKMHINCRKKDFFVEKIVEDGKNRGKIAKRRQIVENHADKLSKTTQTNCRKWRTPGSTNWSLTKCRSTNWGFNPVLRTGVRRTGVRRTGVRQIAVVPLNHLSRPKKKAGIKNVCKYSFNKAKILTAYVYVLCAARSIKLGTIYQSFNCCGQPLNKYREPILRSWATAPGL